MTTQEPNTASIINTQQTVINAYFKSVHITILQKLFCDNPFTG